MPTATAPARKVRPAPDHGEHLKELRREQYAIEYLARKRAFRIEISDETIDDNKAAKQWPIEVWTDHPFEDRSLDTSKPLTPQVLEYLREMQDELGSLIDAIEKLDELANAVYLPTATKKGGAA